eukprot:COSAG05_NODE_668_length_8004_cov_3.894371_7_plen_82_part_00
MHESDFSILRALFSDSISLRFSACMVTGGSLAGCRPLLPEATTPRWRERQQASGLAHRGGGGGGGGGGWGGGSGGLLAWWR